MRISIKPLIHVIIWLLMLCSPLFFFKGQDGLDWIHFARHGVMTLSLMGIFYINYLYIVKHFFSKDGLKKFAIYNGIVIVLFCSLVFVCHRITEPYIEAEREQRRIEFEEKIRNEVKETGDVQFKQDQDKKDPHDGKKKAYDLWDILLNVFAFLCIIGSAIAIRSMQNLYQTEEKRKEEERAKVEAELKMLKNQLNPHFLFNTLNNIYALIAIDQEKSQNAVMELSKLLRYMLYESDQKEVPLIKEIEFINNYVELMRIRLSSKTDVAIKTDISRNESITVAPQIFISLIENAFKHGVSNQAKSFIHFSIEVKENDIIECNLENSYFPKSEEHDKSGSGIGIENMKRRLELIYPGKHSYTIKVEDNVYKSRIIINKSKI